LSWVSLGLKDLAVRPYGPLRQAARAAQRSDAG
jgi:hypothetical protein